jgi:hypothetical protein
VNERQFIRECLELAQDFRLRLRGTVADKLTLSYSAHHQPSVALAFCPPALAKPFPLLRPLDP